MPSSFERKIVNVGQLVAIAQRARAAGKTIVQCHGCFDIVHPGHIRYLEFARRQGDVLVVSLTGDADIAKGDERPYIPQHLRAENLAALILVDYVCISRAPTAVDVLARLKPEVYVKGREYEHSDAPGFLAEKAVVEGYGGRIIFSSGEIVFSSTALIDRMPRKPEAESRRLNLLCRRHHVTRDSIEETLRAFRDLHVLVVGDVVIDRYVMCDAVSVASEAPMMSLVQRDERSYVGGAAIVARHVAALGAHAHLLAAGGDNADTTKIADVLAGDGVEANLLPARREIVEKTRFLADTSKLFKVDRGHRLPLDSVAERRAALIIEGHARIADAVIFCDFGYGMVTGGLLSRVLPMLRHNVRILAADVSGGQANLLSFRDVDLLCPTEREARATLHDYDSGLSAIAWRLLDETQARHLFITLEKRGMVVFGRRSQRRGTAEWSGRLKSEAFPTFADYALDRLGCGDALLAAATLSLAAGDDLMQAAYLGNAAAALEISMLGNKPIGAEAVRSWLQLRPELSASTPAAERDLAPA